METWELVARERIRDTVARYTWAGDALRLAELASTFCEDGELELRGRPPVRGRASIEALLGGGVDPDGDEARRARRRADLADGPRRLVRHLVTNVRFLDVQRHEARVASYFTVVTEIGLDHHGRYRDTFVPVGDSWLIRHRFVSTDWAAPNSTMASPSDLL